MKLLALKLCSLLVILAGVLAIIVMMQSNLGPDQQVLGDCPLQPWVSAGGMTMAHYAETIGYGGYLGWTISVLLILFGFYSLLPKMGGGSRTVVYPAQQGDVIIELKPVRKTMLHILKAMPEVKKVLRLDIKPDQDRRLAVIEMDAIVHNDLNVPARVVYERINQAIVQSGGDMLGLELFLPINLRIKGVDLDTGSAGEAIQQNYPVQPVESVQEPGAPSEDVMTYASATAPAAPEPPGAQPAAYEEAGQGWGQTPEQLEPMQTADEEDLPEAGEEDRQQ